MCSFGSCQMRFEFLSQFRKVWNAFECFVTQVQTRLPKTKCVWPMKINVICTVYCLILPIVADNDVGNLETNAIMPHSLWICVMYDVLFKCESGFYVGTIRNYYDIFMKINKWTLWMAIETYYQFLLTWGTWSKYIISYSASTIPWDLFTMGASPTLLLFGVPLHSNQAMTRGIGGHRADRIPLGLIAPPFIFRYMATENVSWTGEKSTKGNVTKSVNCCAEHRKRTWCDVT